MSEIDQRQRGINDRIERVRRRIRDMPAVTPNEKALKAAFLGLLDLLADEL